MIAGDRDYPPAIRKQLYASYLPDTYRTKGQS
jgi:hypothetical protein